MKKLRGSQIANGILVQVLLSQQHYFLCRRALGFVRRSALASCRKVVPCACDVIRLHVDIPMYHTGIKLWLIN